MAPVTDIVAHVVEAFNRADRNGDGELSLDEFSDFARGDPLLKALLIDRDDRAVRRICRFGAAPPKAEIEKEISRLQGLDIGDEDDGGSGSIANDGANDGANDAVGCGQNRFHADKLKKLYREVARKFHPDLVTCEIERHHRHQLMVEANRAYETGAEDRLNDLLKAGESLESVSDVAMSAEMILLLRKIEEAKSSLAGIEVDTANILASELYRLRRRIEAADTLGVNILNDLVSQVDRQIRKAKNRLEHLRELVVS